MTPAGRRVPPRAGRAALAALALMGMATACEGKPPPKTHAVEIRGFAFVPARVDAAPGDTVVWTNRDMVPHTATSSAAAGWDSGEIVAGGSWRWVVPEGGAGEYVCAYHPSMKGTVE